MMTDSMAMEKPPTTKERLILMTIREGLLLILAGIEDYLGIPRTKDRKRDR